LRKLSDGEPGRPGIFSVFVTPVLVNRIAHYIAMKPISFQPPEGPFLGVRESQLVTSPLSTQALAEALPHAQNCVWDHAGSFCPCIFVSYWNELGWSM